MTDIQRWSHRIIDTPEGPHVWHDKNESGEWVRYADHVEALRQAEQRNPEVPIQGEHDPLCFPAIRDVRIGDWGPSCFTCEVVRMARVAGLHDGYEQAIRDAVHRVEALSHESCAECCEVDVIAAIKGDNDD